MAVVYSQSTHSIDRPRLIDWLSHGDDVRLRVVTAPFGFGKSWLLQSYVATRPGARYVAIEAIRDVTPARFAQGLAKDRIHEVAIDAVEPCDREFLSETFGAVLSMQLNVRFIVGARSRDVIEEPSWFIDGTAEGLCAAALAFDASEVAQLCKVHHVVYRNQDLDQLIRDTDGWPMVAHAVIRHARRMQLQLVSAYESWLVENGAMLRDAIASQLSEHGPNVFSESWSPTFNDLRELERDGLFVIRRMNQYNLLRPVSEVVHREANQTRDIRRRPVYVNFLGEFNVRIHGKRVEWLRRKEGQLFKYLLLSPGGTATRVELTRIFWPQHDAPQARQNLRTACSNIRAALRECAPLDEIDRYFSSDSHMVTVGSGFADCDLTEYNKSFDTAMELLRNGMTPEALDHLRSAKALYRGELIVDPAGSFYQSVAVAAAHRFSKIQRLLAESSETSRPVAKENDVAVGEFTLRKRPSR